LGKDEEKTGKRARERTLDDEGLKGIGCGTAMDGEGEWLCYTVNGGSTEDETIGVVEYPRDD
jgi:hypothetical protein